MHFKNLHAKKIFNSNFVKIKVRLKNIKQLLQCQILKTMSCIKRFTTLSINHQFFLASDLNCRSAGFFHHSRSLVSVPKAVQRVDKELYDSRACLPSGLLWHLAKLICVALSMMSRSTAARTK